MRFKPFVVLPLLALSLAGCFGSSPPSMVAAPMPTMPYPGMPVAMPSAMPDMSNGPSLYDAHHQVQRYVSLHYSDARMVKSWAEKVGASGRIATDGTWNFTYAVKYQASPAATTSSDVQTSTSSFETQAVDVPSRFETQYLTFALTGTNQLLAPEALKTAVAPDTFDFEQALSLGKVLEICQQYGLGIGSFGLKVTLRAGDDGGAVYEIDNSLTYQQPYGMQQPVYRGKMPYPYPTANPYPYDQPYGGGGYAPTKLGVFVVDAYTGELLDHP